MKDLAMQEDEICRVEKVKYLPSVLSACMKIIHGSRNPRSLERERKRKEKKEKEKEKMKRWLDFLHPRSAGGGAQVRQLFLSAFNRF